MIHSSSPLTLIGIDPGYDRVGWCIGQAQAGLLTQISFGCIVTKRGAPIADRYFQIDQELSALLEKFHPAEAAVETLFFSKNQKTAMQVSEARGVIISCLLRQKVKLFEYNPMQIKLSVTGYGNADKTAVKKMVELQLGSLQTNRSAQPATLVKPPKLAILDDTVDAIAIAMTHAAQRKLLI